MPCSRIGDQHGDMAGDPPAAGYGRNRFLCDESQDHEQKKRIPPFGGTLDQKRLSCTICGGADSGVEFPDISR